MDRFVWKQASEQPERRPQMSISSRTPKAGKAPRAEKTAKAPKAARSKQVNDIEDEAPAAKPVAAKAAASGDDAALSKRLPEMTDFQLRAYQQSTTRISGDVKHAKSAAAKNTLALIEELYRADGLPPCIRLTPLVGEATQPVLGAIAL